MIRAPRQSRRSSARQAPRATPRRAFTLIDAVATIAATGVLGALGVSGISAGRMVDQHTNCTNKLLGISAGNAQFALSNNGLMAGLNWQTGGANSQYPDLNAQQATPGAASAHSAQAIDILRRRGRPDLPVMSSWMPDINYWSLALVDFQNRDLSDAFNICPSHDNLNKWRRWPAAFDAGRFMPAQPPPGAINKRWPYSSSYRLTGAAFDLNQSILTTAAAANRISISTAHNMYTIPGSAVLGPSPMAQVAFPSQKAHVFDSSQRHLGGIDLYFCYPASTQPVLFFDGSVRVCVSQNAITPWSPNSPTSPFPQSYLYQPQLWETRTQSGQSADSVQDRFLFTRDGLLGRDFAN